MRNRLRALLSWVWTAGKPWIPAAPLALAFAYGVGLAVSANLYFMRSPGALLHRSDEGYVVAFARRMLEGHNLPYVDAVSHRGPLFYWIAALAVKIYGYGTWMPMRALTLVTMLLTISLGFAAACVARRALAAAIFVLVYLGACTTSMERTDGLAFHSEDVVSVFGMLALLCTTAAFRDRPRYPRVETALVFVAGACVMLGGLAKQVGIVAALPFGLWVLSVSCGRRERSLRSRWGLLVAYTLGFLVPLTLVLLRYAVAHELPTLYYYTIAYNLSVYGPAIHATRGKLLVEAFMGHFDLLLVGAPLLGWGLSLVFVRARGLRDLAHAYASHGFDATVAYNAGLALLVADSSLRNFTHYYLQVLPWAALLVGIAVDHVTRRGGFEASRFPVRSLLARAAVLLPMATVVEAGWSARKMQYATDPGVKDAYATQDWGICRWLRARTKPTDSIFVWGFDPAPYTACNRRPASRYVYTTFVEGFVPWVDETRAVEDARATPGSREILLAELEREMPAVVFDSPIGNGRSLMNYEFLRPFVVANYCREPVNLGPTVWTRKPPQGCLGTPGP
jgi:hypothetical protein